MRDAWQSAFESGDSAALAALYTVDGSVLPPNAEAVTGRSEIEAFWNDFSAAGLGGVIVDSEADARGDLGYKGGRYTITDTDGNTVDEGKYIEIWRRVDGNWQLHRDIFNSDRPAAAVAEGPANRVVVIARVADTTQWEQGFRTHGDLLSSMSMSESHYAMNDDSNRIAVYSEPESLDEFMTVMESQATADAMEFDGIDRDTVEVFVFDKVFEY